MESSQPRAIAVNSRYAAFADQDGYIIRGLEDTSRDVYELPCKTRAIDGRIRTSLALSQVRTTLLALSIGTQIYIHNVDSGQLVFILKGIGRAITCISWSRHDADTLAAGMVDGSICIWTTKNLIRPLHRFQSGSGPCTHIAFSRVDETVLASSLDDQVAVWSLHNPRKPLWSRDKGPATVFNMDWSPAGTGKLLVSSVDNKVTLWDVMKDLDDTGVELHDENDSDDENYGVFGQLEDATSLTPPIAQLHFDETPTHVEWVGTSGILIFLDSRSEVIFYGSSDIANLVQIWRLELDHSSSTVAVQCPNGIDRTILAISWTHCQTYKLPIEIRDALGWHSELSRARASDLETPDVLKEIKGSAQIVEPDADITVKPVEICRIRKEGRSFTKTSRQLKQRRLPIRGSPSQRESITQLDSPSPHRLTSSLELPPDLKLDAESPMPFLSPGIPARRSLPNMLLPLDDSLDIPPLEHNSFDSGLDVLEQNKHDSDSDDDTFAEGLRGSGTFMPGSLNVPLPKSGGAIFAPNGQLVVFLPPRPRPTSALIDNLKDNDPDGDGSYNGVARLFPTFGNLAGDIFIGNDDDSDSGHSDEKDPKSGASLPKFAIQSSSFPSQQSWKLGFSPADPAFGDKEGLRKIRVSVQDMHSVLPGSREAAGLYRYLCGEDESPVDLCYHNCKVARECGFKDVADIWRLVAMVLDSRVPLDVLTMTGGADDVVVVARKVSSLVRSTPDIRDVADDTVRRGRLRWADHPFGAPWIARKSLEWAENRADIQMLACLSAVFAGTQGTTPSNEALASRSVLAANPSKVDYFSYFEPPPTAQAIPVPILRTNSKPTTPLYGTPPKPRLSSRGSSRNHSQVTTPYFESAQSTPPLILPPLSRQNSRLSASGSSPEHHRSSFSAAAKYYALSITDKFAAYGTSPPTKRLRGSPNNAELSSSLPMPTGSWSKSVSFATTVDTGKGSQLSTSYSAVDDDDDDYDSDQTIEDASSVPLTPKSPVMGDVVVKMKQRDAFSDSISGGARASLLPAELMEKSILWRRTFAGQLRSWDLFIQAAELEKTVGRQDNNLNKYDSWDGVVPSRKSKQRRPTCSICFAMISGLQQLCPSCLHVTHLECMEEHLISLGDEEFSCPTGCGCSCDKLPLELIETSPSERPTHDTKTVKRRTSFTDPRYWRAKMEDDTW